MAKQFDVVIVGARCAGSPLATLLARKGIDVAVVERATFPKDTLSTHVFEADGLAFLDRLGVTEELRLTGAPFVRRVDTRIEDVRFTVEWPQQPGDIGGIAAVRRFILDPILARAADAAGADVRMAAPVVGLLSERGRVSGVRVAGDGEDAEIRARLVVGADGRNSTVARLCHARKYNLTPNKRAGYYAYFEDTPTDGEPTFVFHRWADRIVLGCPTDSGLYLTLAMPDLAEIAEFRADPESRLMEHARSCEPVARMVGGARRVGKILGIVRWCGFFREAAGPGWVLVGDAGHFKDPAAGRGISDAFCQVEKLAEEIASGLDRPDAELDAAMTSWGRWRDRDFSEFYWAATDMGREGRVRVVVPEVVRGLRAEGKEELLLDIQNHRTRPSQAVTAPRVFRAIGRLLRRGGVGRRRVLPEVGAIAVEEIRRRRIERRPVFADSDGASAGETEVENPLETRV